MALPSVVNIVSLLCKGCGLRAWTKLVLFVVVVSLVVSAVVLILFGLWFASVCRKDPCEIDRSIGKLKCSCNLLNCVSIESEALGVVFRKNFTLGLRIRWPCPTLVFASVVTCVLKNVVTRLTTLLVGVLC